MRTALATGDMGFLHSFTTGSTVDGPGVRVVGWTSGCHWRCLYCHNPDTWNMTNGIPVSLARATEELRRVSLRVEGDVRRLHFERGEPLMQDRFAVKLLAAAKQMEIHTALDTNGSLGARLSDAELENIDLVLLDLKSWEPELHRRITGMEVGPVLDFARRLADRRKKIWVRFVLVPGLSDDPENVAKIARFAADLESYNESTFCPSTKWGDSNGRNLNSTTRLTMFSRRPEKLSHGSARSFARWSYRTLSNGRESKQSSSSY